MLVWLARPSLTKAGGVEREEQSRKHCHSFHTSPVVLDQSDATVRDQRRWNRFLFVGAGERDYNIV